MIAEALEWLATPCPLYVRRLGLLSESIAISARHRRCREAWVPHLEQSRYLILGRPPTLRSVQILLLKSVMFAVNQQCFALLH